MKWTANQVAMLQSLRGANRSFTQCAVAMNLSPGQIAGKCNRLRGYKSRRKQPAERKHPGEDFGAPDATEVLAAALIADGDSPATVAAELGMSPASVRQAVIRSRARERNEVASDKSKRSAWGRCGSDRDA